MVSAASEGTAWARSREREDGPAVGEELDRLRAGNRCEFGGRVAANESSDSGSGGSAGTPLGSGEVGRGDSGESDTTLRDESRRLLGT